MSSFTTLLASVLVVKTLVSGASLPIRLSQRDAEPTCLGKDQGTTFTSVTSEGAYDIICGQDYLGGDLRSFQVETLNGCLTACDTERSCVAVAYANSVCYLKNQLTTAVPNTAVWSAKKQNAQSPSLSCLNNADNGKTYLATKGAFKIICGQEYGGGDLTSASTASFEACIEACVATTQCIDVSYVNGACYLKQKVSTLIDASYVWTAQLINPPSTSGTQDELTCVDNKDNGKSYTTKNGGTYIVECGVDHAGGDLRSVDSTTFETCMDACDAASSCVDMSWVWGTCYLKNTLTEGSAVGHVWTGRLDKVAQVSPVLSTTLSVPTDSASLSTITFLSIPPTTSISISSMDNPGSVFSVPSTTILASSDAASSSMVSPVPTSSTSLTPSASSAPPSSSTAFSTPTQTPGPSSSVVVVSSATVTLSASSSSISSTSSPTDVASSSISSSATISAALSLSTDFCLRIVTPNILTTGNYITNVGVGANLVIGSLDTPRPVIRFKLESSGRLVTTTGNIISVAGTPGNVSVMRPYTPAVVNANPAVYPSHFCSLTEDNTLQCSASKGGFTWVAFAFGGNLRILSESTAPVSSSYTTLQLGAVPGAQCPSTA